MSKPNTNQASEDELSVEIDSYIDDIRYNNEVPFDERLESAKKSIKHLFRTEKLKLLAEVRERVVGEDVTLNSFEIPVYEEEFVIISVTQQNRLRADQRISLAKLEAEL